MTMLIFSETDADREVVEGESFRRISHEDVAPDLRLQSTSSASSDCIIEQNFGKLQYYLLWCVCMGGGGQ